MPKSLWGGAHRFISIRKENAAGFEKYSAEHRSERAFIPQTSSHGIKVRNAHPTKCHGNSLQHCLRSHFPLTLVVAVLTMAHVEAAAAENPNREKWMASFIYLSLGAWGPLPRVFCAALRHDVRCGWMGRARMTRRCVAVDEPHGDKHIFPYADGIAVGVAYNYRSRARTL